MTEVAKNFGLLFCHGKSYVSIFCKTIGWATFSQTHFVALLVNLNKAKGARPNIRLQKIRQPFIRQYVDMYYSPAVKA
jgi:hypothetical protein